MCVSHSSLHMNNVTRLRRKGITTHCWQSVTDMKELTDVVVQAGSTGSNTSVTFTRTLAIIAGISVTSTANTGTMNITASIATETVGKY